MAWKLKVISMLLLSTGLLGAWFYVQNLRSENEILTLNNASLKQAASDLQSYAKELKADAEEKSKQARRRMEQIASLQRQAATLSSELREASKDDPKTIECLAVRPGADFVNSLRQYTEGVRGAEAGEGVSGTEPLREPDSGRSD